MRKVYLLAVAAAMFAACTTNDNLENNNNAPALQPGEVGFEAYTQRSVTRSGSAGTMDLTKLQATGFGVFGYYTDNNEYEPSRVPDFMYNQKVEWNTSYWGYEPIKYWPNEYGSMANSDDNDKVSFFAYAPYVEVTPSNGKVVKANATDDQWGITALSRNSLAGDPLVKYICNFDADKRVDLCWGVCDDPQWAVVQGGTVQNINDGVKGLPWLNVERPMEAKTQALANQRMRFTFKHALSQFSVSIDAFVDGLNADNPLADKTKIYVRQISFTGFALKGALNLNNSDPNKALWYDYNGTGDIESGAAITIYDGRKDGKEGAAGADASNEKMRGLNPDIISNYDDVLGKGNTTEGVTNIAKPLFSSSYPAMVIPTGEDIEVEIVYDVETEDANLATKLSDGKTNGSSIENRISKTVSFGADGMQNGKLYTLALHLGMNSVKFDAAVSEWQEVSDDPQADLPLNMPSWTAQASAITNEVEVTSDRQDYLFAVYGMTPGETVEASLVGVTAGPLFGKTLKVDNVGDFSNEAVNSNTANVSGMVFVKVEDVENLSVENVDRNGYLLVKGATSNKEVKISMAQYAHPLGLAASAVAGTDITLSTTATETVWGSKVTSWSVKKNGIDITGTSTFAEATGAGATLGTLTLPAAVVAGDKYTITMKAGDAAEETYALKIGGISFSSTASTVTYRTSPIAALPVNIYSGGAYTVTWSPASGTNASVAADGKITTIQAGNEVITATIAPTDEAAENAQGWFYTADTKTTQNYTLTIGLQNAVGTFTIADKASQAVAAGGDVVTGLAATFKGALDTTSDASGAVTYEVTAVKKGATDVAATTFVVDGTTVKVGTSDLDAASTYTVTVRATKAASTAFAAAPVDATFTVTTD